MREHHRITADAHRDPGSHFPGLTFAARPRIYELHPSGKHQTPWRWWPDLAPVSSSSPESRGSQAPLTAISHDPLAQAVDELGKVHASIYYVQVLGSPELRRASRRGQNRHESQNQLGRAIVIGAKGEIRAPDQEVAAATLFAHTLVQSKILYYNTWHFGELLPEVRRDGFDVRPEVLGEISPLIFRHINFRGTYDFTMSEEE